MNTTRELFSFVKQSDPQLNSVITKLLELPLPGPEAALNLSRMRLEEDRALCRKTQVLCFC